MIKKTTLTIAAAIPVRKPAIAALTKLTLVAGGFIQQKAQKIIPVYRPLYFYSPPINRPITEFTVSRI
jgi:hypothetical protein